MNNIEKIKEILMSEDITESINSNFNYLISVIPELTYSIGFNQNHPHHHLTVFDHTVLALSKSENIFDVRLTLLLHDIGKPFSYQDGTDGVRHFKNHPEKSAEMSKVILERLGFDNDYINKILYLIKNHDSIINVEEINNENYEIEKLRLMVQYADAKAHDPRVIPKRIMILDNINKNFKNI